jgi:hypothetical protein
MIRFIFHVSLIAIVVFIGFVLLTVKPVANEVSYGMSFSTMHAKELGLDWKEVYRGALDDLGIRKFRIPAYWPETEPERDQYDFSALDYQLSEARKRDATVILAVGRRLPRWPECHTPYWVGYMPWEEQKEEIRQYLTLVVERYRNDPTVTHWQVENEPYLNAFANEICGDLDESFLKEEIALVKLLDPHRPILVTDSGNLGMWMKPYKNGDSFGTSMYIYFSNPELGEFKTKLPPIVYRMKERLMEILFGPKETFLIELSLEPWLTEPTARASVDEQLSRMDAEKFDEILAYARETSFSAQYLWGVEWWWYMRSKDHPEFWDKAKGLF